MLLVSPGFKALSELVAEGSIKIFYTVSVTSSVQLAESVKGHMRLLEVVTDVQRATGPCRK